MVCAECGTDMAQARTGRPRTYCSRSCQGRAYRRRRDEGRLAAVRRGTSAAGASQSTVDAAIGLADAQGIRALSLRSLAHTRGVALVVLQRDLGSRDRLVALMVQRVVGAAATARPLTDEEAPLGALTRLAEAEWQTYRAHPWLVEVMTTTRPPLVPAVLESAQAVIEAFMDLGLDPEEAFDRYLALSAFIQGMATLLGAEQQEGARTGTSYRGWWLHQLGVLERTGATVRHPWLGARGEVGRSAFAGSQSAGTSAADSAFRAGLPRILHGLTVVDPRSVSAAYSESS